MPDNRLVVVGSVNWDQVAYLDHHPRFGETVLTDRVVQGVGGKGANQAAAAALHGSAVSLVAQVGDDAAGRACLGQLDAAGVDCGSVARLPGARTGGAWIMVDASGENTIVVDPGTNASLSGEQVVALLAEVLDRHAEVTTVLSQGEVSSSVLVATAEEAARRGLRWILNLAPVIALPVDVLRLADPLVVNEGELGDLLWHLGTPPTGDVPDDVDSLRRLVECPIVVTWGALGVAVLDASGLHHEPAVTPPAVVNTAGAGDAFVGAMSSALTQGRPLRQAIVDGVVAGAAAVATSSASSLPPPS